MKYFRASIVVMFFYLVGTSIPLLAQEQGPESYNRVGLLPSVFAAFKLHDGAVVSDEELSEAVERIINAALLNALQDKEISPVVIAQGEAGTVDKNRLLGTPAFSELRPFPQERLMAPYPAEKLSAVIAQQQLASVWLISGVQLPGTESSRQGTRLLLSAVLIDRDGRVLFSDVLDDTPTDLLDAQETQRHVNELLAEYRTEAQKAEDSRHVMLKVHEQQAAQRAAIHAETRIGLGFFMLTDDGADWAISYRPAEWHWQIGYHYASWRDRFNDPFTGQSITETTYSLQGPQLNYLFHPDQEATWYVGVSLLVYKIKDKSMLSGKSDADSTNAPAYGGGYTGYFGKHVYYNMGAFLAPGVTTETKTSTSYRKETGLFDVQLQIGVTF